MMVRGVVLEFGFIPPEAGPLRDAFLEVTGREQLDAYRHHMAIAQGYLHGATPPATPSPVGHDVASRTALAVATRADWNGYRKALPARVLAAIEPHIRGAERAAVSALNHLEDHPDRDAAHAAVHHSGAFRSGLFGCPIVADGEHYWSGCAVRIAHHRTGISAGLTGDFACNICGELVEDCDHLAGEPYPLTVSHDTGRCNVCDESTCTHRDGSTVLLRAFGKAVNMQAHEVSIVPRPRYPNARFTEVTVDGDVRRGTLVGKSWFGGPGDCHWCLNPCRGLREPDGVAMLASW